MLPTASDNFLRFQHEPNACAAPTCFGAPGNCAPCPPPPKTPENAGGGGCASVGNAFASQWQLLEPFGSCPKLLETLESCFAFCRWASVAARAWLQPTNVVQNLEENHRCRLFPKFAGPSPAHRPGRARKPRNVNVSVSWWR
eukprot:15420007-Alexandrium_andersonii.AAC.1